MDRPAATLGRIWREADLRQRIPHAIGRRVDSLLIRSGIRKVVPLEELVARSDGTASYVGNRFDLRHPRMTTQIAEAIIGKSYERREIELIRRHVMPNDKVIELGAGAGVTSLLLSDMVGCASHIVFEADRQNLELSRHMFALNGKPVRSEHAVLLSGNDIPREIAIYSNANPSSSSLVERSGTERVEQVPAMRLEDVLEVEQSTVLVLDIEGGERDLFVNAERLGHLTLIILESHPWIIGEDATSEMLDAIFRHGFSIHRSYMDGRYLVLTRGRF